MAYESAMYYGNHTGVSVYGDKLMASDGNGDLDEYSEYLTASGRAPEFVTAEELSTLIEHAAAIDIARGELTYPPDVTTTLRMATEFFETYLKDTNTPRVEVVDRYVAKLIELLEDDEAASYDPTLEEVSEYVGKVHAMLEQPSVVTTNATVESAPVVLAA